MQVTFDKVTRRYLNRGRIVTALDGVSWDASGGQVLAVLGPNGAGKSTMLRALLGTLPLDHGEILIDGQKGSNSGPAFWRRAGYLPEERGLYRDERVLRMLVYLGQLKGMPEAIARCRALALLEQFGLKDRAGVRISTLSKGMNQKVQIVATLLHDPELVVLDEPFSGLDPVALHELRDTIAALKGKGKLVLLSTHAMREVESLCDRLLMINHGRRVLYGEVTAIRRQHAGCDVLLNADACTAGIDIIEKVASEGDGKRVTLKPGSNICDLMSALAARRYEITRLESAARPLEEIFFAVTEGSKP